MERMGYQDGGKLLCLTFSFDSLLKAAPEKVAFHYRWRVSSRNCYLRVHFLPRYPAENKGVVLERD